MIIIRCHGGLGNQMFQYALYLSLLNSGYDATLDIDEYRESKCRTFQLADAFGLIFREFSYPISIRLLTACAEHLKAGRKKPNPCYLLGIAMNKAAWLLRDLFDGSFEQLDDKQLLDLNSLGFSGNAVFNGYWQSSTYFFGLTKELRSAFTFRKLEEPEFIRILALIGASESVSVHIRRGDYVANQRFAEIYGGICNDSYYMRAIEHISAFIKKPKYFIFSDDIVWAKTAKFVRELADYEVVSLPEGPSWRDMALMSACKSNIIANSSYSWWATWLNNNPNKITIAPSRWVNDYDDTGLSDLRNIYEKNWILVDP